MKKIITTILLITSISCSSIPEQNNNNNNFAHKELTAKEQYQSDLKEAGYIECYYLNQDKAEQWRIEHDPEICVCLEREGSDYYFEVCLAPYQDGEYWGLEYYNDIYKAKHGINAWDRD